MEFRQWHGIMTNFLPINKISPFGQCHIQTVLALQVHLISVNGPKWFDISKNLKHVSNRQVTPRSYPWPPTVRTGCSCSSGPSESSGNGPKWFAIPKNLVLDTKIKSLCCSEAELLHEELDHLFRIFVRSGFFKKLLLPYAYVFIRFFF